MGHHSTAGDGDNSDSDFFIRRTYAERRVALRLIRLCRIVAVELFINCAHHLDQRNSQSCAFDYQGLFPPRDFAADVRVCCILRFLDCFDGLGRAAYLLSHPAYSEPDLLLADNGYSDIVHYRGGTRVSRGAGSLSRCRRSRADCDAGLDVCFPGPVPSRRGAGAVSVHL